MGGFAMRVGVGEAERGARVIYSDPPKLFRVDDPIFGEAEMSAFRLLGSGEKPRVRVKAWRRPNEDYPTDMSPNVHRADLACFAGRKLSVSERALLAQLNAEALRLNRIGAG